MPHQHWADGGGPVCRFKTKRECDEAYADWQADQQVLLAEWVVSTTSADAKRGSTEFDRLVAAVRSGGTIDGEASFTRRLAAALERRRTADADG